MKTICFISILILNLDGSILQDKHEAPIQLETEHPEEINIKCSEEAEKIKNRISTHTWEYIKGKPETQGFYLNDGAGRLVIGYLY